jgi:hypothetical protein
VEMMTWLVDSGIGPLASHVYFSVWAAVLWGFRKTCLAFSFRVYLCKQPLLVRAQTDRYPHAFYACENRCNLRKVSPLSKQKQVNSTCDFIFPAFGFPTIRVCFKVFYHRL